MILTDYKISFPPPELKEASAPDGGPALTGNRFYDYEIVSRDINTSRAQFKVSAALSAGLRLAEGLAAMPVVYGNIEYDEKGRATKTPRPQEKLARILALAPNDFMTDVELREHMMLHALYTGTGRAFIRRTYRGKSIKEILPAPDVKPARDATTGKVTYTGEVDGEGDISGATRRDFIEVSNPRWDAICGLDITNKLRDIMKLALALQDRHTDDAAIKSVRGYFTFPDAIGEEVADTLKDRLDGALANSPILDSNAAYKTLVPTASELQLLEGRRFAIEEIARAYGIHPLLLGHDGAGQSLTRVADVMDYHVTITLKPWVLRWEKAIAFSMLGPDEFVDLDEMQYYRMNLSDRANYGAKALGSGGGHAYLTQNEVRAQNGLSPIEGGDVLPQPIAAAAGSAEQEQEPEE